MPDLLKLFGPSREEIWRGLAAELGADYVRSGFWKRDRVEAAHGHWTVTLDTYHSPAAKCDYTRLRAPYVNPDGFRFTICRRGLFSDLAKMLGMQDVEVGHESFDRDFIIKGTDAAKLHKLFANRRLRELIEAQPEIHFTVQSAKGAAKGAAPPRTDELCFSVPGTIKDEARLRLLFDLFAETLDQLCRMGSAYEKTPAACG